MDGSELFGRVIRCNYAKALTKIAHGKAIWTDEEWIKSHLEDGAEVEEPDVVPSDLTLLPSREIDEEQ
jgi:hypothetical protein